MLTEAHWFWPVVLFPFAVEKAHTRTFTGKAVLRDIKGSFSRAIVDLNDDALVVRGRLTRIEHLVIPLEQFHSVSLHEKPNLVDIRFSEGRYGRLARIVTSGTPAGSRSRIFLNVKNPEVWEREITLRTR